MPRADSLKSFPFAPLTGILTGAVFLAAAGNRLVFANDEGLYLEGAVRVFRGAAPYKDFFAITGPGTFWSLAALFRLFGVSLESARLLHAIELAVMTGLTYWITARLGRRLTAACAALLFAAMATGLPGGLVVNHRWESSALALGAIAFGVRLLDKPRWATAAAAGALTVLAAWCTPSVGLVTAAIGAWILCDSKLRRALPAYAAGAFTAAAIPPLWLASQDALMPMIRGMGWNGAHYSLANHVVYGAMFDNPLGVLGGAHGVQRITAAWFLFATLLPAALPPLAAAAWIPALRRPRSTELFLLACGAALAGSALPRWDLMHLLCVAPLFVVLAAVWLERNARGLGGPGLALAALVPAVMMSAMNLAGSGWQEAVETPVGKVRTSAEEARHLRMCLERIRPGDTLFVFPYQAMHYFITGGRNPTRYAFLQPGMMSPADERAVADELKANPPAWVLYADLPAEYYLRIWPSSNPAALRMPLIEEFVSKNYSAVADAGNEGAEYRLMAGSRPGLRAYSR